MKIREILILADHDQPSRFRGIARFAGEHGWQLRVEDLSMPPHRWQGDGALVTLDGTPKLRAFARELMKRNIPVVDMVENESGLALPRVTGNNRGIGQLAAQHFQERDFKNAAFFALRRSPAGERRAEGLMKRWNGWAEEWFWSDAAAGHADDWRRLEAWLGDKLASAPKPLAILAWNDNDATHLLNLCRWMNLAVPEDVAILGVDNNETICENQSVPLSSVVHDLERIGYEAAAALAQLMDGRRPQRRTLHIPPKGIRERQSTHTFAINDPLLKPAITAIEQNLARPFGAAQLAAELNLPRIRLDRLFAAHLGHSVGAEIARRRIAKAKLLLQTTELPLAEVAQRCGYCHAPFLVRTFKKAFGLTPAAWRASSKW